MGEVVLNVLLTAWLLLAAVSMVGREKRALGLPIWVRLVSAIAVAAFIAEKVWGHD